MRTPTSVLTPPRVVVTVLVRQGAEIRCPECNKKHAEELDGSVIVTCRCGRRIHFST